MPLTTTEALDLRYGDRVHLRRMTSRSGRRVLYLVNGTPKRVDKDGQHRWTTVPVVRVIGGQPGTETVSGHDTVAIVGGTGGDELTREVSND